jgi:hypothetical protein
MAKKVTLYLRIRDGYAFIKPMWQGKRLRPLWGVLKGVPIYCPDALGYYLRYTKDGKQITKPIGKDATSCVCDYESCERIGMMHTNRSDYPRIRHAQAVNHSNSLAV